jgi:hypothetical protein
MKLEEIIGTEEWERLARLMYDSTWQALTAYQQHVTPSVAKLKPQVAAKVKALTHKTKPAPYAAQPKPLPKPSLPPQTKAATTTAYRPIKTRNLPPPTTRKAMLNVKHRASNPISNKSVQQGMPQPTDMDQAGRMMLPANKRGPNPIDLLSLDERG